MAVTKPYKVDPKSPHDVLDYLFDFAPLTNGRDGVVSDALASGEALLTRTITAESGITVDSDEFANSSTAVRVWLSGGAAENNYTVRCDVTTDGGRTFSRSIIVPVLEI